MTEEELKAWRAGAPERKSLRDSVDPASVIEALYKNHRGETEMRRISPVRLHWGSTEYHPTSQWLLDAVDLTRGERRIFALAGFLVGRASKDWALTVSIQWGGLMIECGGATVRFREDQSREIVSRGAELLRADDWRPCGPPQNLMPGGVDLADMVKR